MVRKRHAPVLPQAIEISLIRRESPPARKSPATHRPERYRAPLPRATALGVPILATSFRQVCSLEFRSAEPCGLVCSDACWPDQRVEDVGIAGPFDLSNENLYFPSLNRREVSVYFVTEAKASLGRKAMAGVSFELISDEEQWEIFDDAARRLLDVDGSEFARRWDCGEYLGSDEPGVMQVAILRPNGWPHAS